jgi:hypothetical protein
LLNRIQEPQNQPIADLPRRHAPGAAITAWSNGASARSSVDSR